MNDNDELLTPGEVAKYFKVDPKTVGRWAKAGKLAAIRTPGGHHRFRRSEVDRVMRGDPAPPAETPPAAVAIDPGWSAGVYDRNNMGGRP